MHWELLRAIALEPGNGPAWYAKRMGVSVSAVSRASDKLQAARFITRKQVPDRGNHIAFELTAAGRKALAEVAG